MMNTNAPHIAQRYANRGQLLGFCRAEDAREWLTDRERQRLDSIRNDRRRNDWMGGRWLGRSLIQKQLGHEVLLRDIDINSRDSNGHAVRPRIHVNGRREHWSLSHTDLGVIAALGMNPQIRVGVDVTRVESVQMSFLRTWFTESERQHLINTPERTIAATWACKEAVYKAVNYGEKFTPRRFDVTISAADDVACRYNDHDLANSCDIRVWDVGELVAAVCVFNRTRASRID